MDPKKISVAQFKAELVKRGLPIGGQKKDFIARLDENDPSGLWMQQIMTSIAENDQMIEENDGHTSDADGDQQNDGHTSDADDDQRQDEAFNVNRRQDEVF